MLNNSRPVAEVAGERIDQAFIGSCANGTLDDLTVAAKVVAGRQVSPKVRLIVTPGSQTIYREAVSKGIIGTLIEAGAGDYQPHLRSLQRRTSRRPRSQ